MRPGSMPTTRRRVPIALAILAAVIALIGFDHLPSPGGVNPGLVASAGQTGR